MIKEQERKLAAIMFTDMVGYSSLTQEDEALAIELLEEHRQILRPFFPKHGGREVETVGDAFFVEFSSALEAVKCAIEIQKELWERNKSVPVNKQIKIRIGIHLGDVVHKGDNVLGDGVNIAARIEPLAQSCGICVSEDVARQVQNKIKFPLKRIDKSQLKNIKMPVDIYTLVLPWLEKKFAPKSSTKRNKLFILSLFLISVVLITAALYYFPDLIRLTDKPEPNMKPEIQWDNSIAILPFEDLSQEGDQEWFCDGMTEQIISNLSRLPRLKVIARQSMMKFKDSDKSISEIGQELNVAYVLESSIRKFGDRIRVTAQLINTSDEIHLWSQDYDQEYQSLFDVQDEVSEKIAINLLNKISGGESLAIRTNRPNNIEAYEYYLKAKHLHYEEVSSFQMGTDPAVKSLNKSEEMFKKSITLDPNFADSYAALADVYNTYYNFYAQTDEERDNYWQLSESYLDTALLVNPNSAEAYYVMHYLDAAKAEEYYKAEDFEKYNHELYEQYKSLTRAIKFNANHVQAYATLGYFLQERGLDNLSIKCFNKALQLDPINYLPYVTRGRSYFRIGEYRKAEADFKIVLEKHPKARNTPYLYVELLIVQKRYKEAEKILRNIKRIYPDSNTDWEYALIFASKGQKEKVINTYKGESTAIYSLLGMNDEAIRIGTQWCEEHLIQKSSVYYRLINHPFYKNIRTDLRFPKLLAKHKKLYEENLEKYGDINI
jgi:adenylate cyclase